MMLHCGRVELKSSVTKLFMGRSRGGYWGQRRMVPSKICVGVVELLISPKVQKCVLNIINFYSVLNFNLRSLKYMGLNIYFFDMSRQNPGIFCPPKPRTRSPPMGRSDEG